MSNFISYLRVSTAGQGRSGLGLEAQREAVKRHVGSGQVIEEYVEIESGKKTDRPQLDKALRHAKATGATLVCAKLDRVGRRASHVLGILDNSGIKVEFANAPTASALELGVLAVVAQQEGLAISERTTAALQAAKARGVRLGNPNGAAALRRYEAENGNAAGVEGCQKAADTFANETREWIESAMAVGCGSANAIAGHLNAKGIRTRRGKAWTHKQVGHVLDRLGIDLTAKLPGNAYRKAA